MLLPPLKNNILLDMAFPIELKLRYNACDQYMLLDTDTEREEDACPTRLTLIAVVVSGGEPAIIAINPGHH